MFYFIQLEIEIEATESHCLSRSVPPDFRFKASPHTHNTAFDLRKRPTQDGLNYVQHLQLTKTVSYMLTH